MGKRAAASTAAAAKAKASKTTKKVEAALEEEIIAAPAVTDPFAQECASVLKLLEEVTVADSCREMLAAAVPHGLRTAPADRHEYQNTVIKIIEDLFASVEATRSNAVQAAQTAVDESNANKGAAQSEIDACTERIKTKTEARDSRNAEMKAADEGVVSAKKDLDAAIQSEKDCAKEMEDAAAEKVEHEKVGTDLVAPLKEGNFPGAGWRVRNKDTDTLVAVLKKLDCEESFLAGVAATFKQKADARGPFAAKVIERCETVLAEHINSLEKKIGSADEEAAKRKQGVADATAALEVARSKAGVAQEAFVDAENSLVEEETAKSEAEEKLKKLIPHGEELQEVLDGQTAHATRVRKLAASFEKLKDGKKDEPEEAAAPEGEAAADE